MTGSKDVFNAYIHALGETNLKEKTEHTDRFAVKSLLQAFAGPKLVVVHEPKRIPGKGAPDFKVRHNGQIVGYLETKSFGTDLDAELNSEQLRRYRSFSKNIVLTNYLRWIWIRGDSVQSEILCKKEDLTSKKLHLDAERIERIAGFLRGFVSVPPIQIANSSDLASSLAEKSRLLRDFLGDELVRQERGSHGERLYGLYLAFKQQVSESITLAEFADAFAQTLSYGLFLSKLHANGYNLHLHNAQQYIPKSFRVIRELVSFLDELEEECYRDVKWIVDDILSITNGLNVHAIKNDLSFKNRKGGARGWKARDEEEWRLFSRDPFIYFYEDFLSEYDASLRKSRGVYYTPPPVVNFIVRGIDDILKKDFGLRVGLADHDRVTVLDFACGTGTFIVEVIQKIFENLGSSSAKIELAVNEHILKNIFGFEFLIAPYTIAHLKLSQYFEDRQIKIGPDQRFNVFLTNTLEPIELQHNFLLPALTQEAEASQKVKEKPILVITGNPPYAGHSKNKGTWITTAIEAYKQVDGRPLGEKNSKWLQDDYVKFFRFSQMKMDNVTEGVVGIITNHSWIDNPTFRGMRRSLMKTFDQVWVLDLHGNAKKKESAPDGSEDQNVFDIEQGVAVSLLVKKLGIPKGVWHADLWGQRLDKYKYLASNSFSEVAWKKVEPVEPFYLFIPQKRELWEEYETGWPVPEIFPVNVLGFQTHRDHFAVAIDRADIEQRAQAMSDKQVSDEFLREKYDLADNRDWKLSAARNSLKSVNWRNKVARCAYRPFDDRWCCFGYEFMDYPRRELLEHVADKNNLVLGVGRSGAAIPERPWELAIVSSNPVDANIFRRGGVNLFPLYLFAGEKRTHNRIADLFEIETDPFRGKKKIENIAPHFRNWVDTYYSERLSAEQIIGYIYAILYALSYRERYAEFLKIDFPRIPFPRRLTKFIEISDLGSQLVKAHLLKNVPALGFSQYCGKGTHYVDRVRFVEAEQAVYINGSQYFSPVSAEIWNFHIGGHQVLAKYLKDRNGRKLNLSQANSVESIANVLAFTIDHMHRIDKAYRSGFPI